MHAQTNGVKREEEEEESGNENGAITGNNL